MAGKRVEAAVASTPSRTPRSMSFGRTGLFAYRTRLRRSEQPRQRALMYISDVSDPVAEASPEADQN